MKRATTPKMAVRLSLSEVREIVEHYRTGAATTPHSHLRASWTASVIEWGRVLSAMESGEIAEGWYPYFGTTNHGILLHALLAGELKPLPTMEV